MGRARAESLCVGDAGGGVRPLGHQEGRAMTDDPRLRQLLDELLESGATPEEVCASCPELLPQVRDRWRKLRRLRADLDVMFPTSADHGASRPAIPPDGTTPPQISGYEVQGEL